jgi:hypothetical protein
MRRILLTALTIAVAVVATVRAHHGYADYFTTRAATIDGQIEEIAFANPHVVLKVRTKTGTFTAIWDSPNTLLRRGVLVTTLHVGDRVLVTGSPSRNDFSHELALLSEIRRPSDNWSWTNPRRSSQHTN